MEILLTSLLVLCVLVILAFGAAIPYLDKKALEEQERARRKFHEDCEYFHKELQKTLPKSRTKS